MAEETSPLKFNPLDLVFGGSGATGGTSIPGGAISAALGPMGVPLGIASSIGGSIFGAISANKAQKEAEKKEAKAREELNRQKDIYKSLDISNPFLNMENTMEDLTVNQQAAQFKKQQFQQSQSNILDGLRGAAGGSGVAALAQQLSQSGQLASQQSSVDIGRQEQSNQMLERQEASRLQGLEVQGEYQRRADEKERTSTLLGMAQQETAAYAQQAGEAKQAKMNAITGGIKGAASMFAGFGDGQTASQGVTSIPGTTGVANTNVAPTYYNAQGQKIDAQGNLIT